MRDDLADEALMQLTANEDRAAFDALFLRHHRAVFNYTRRMVGENTAAEDLTQECFIRVWRARHRYQTGSPFRPWLFTIAHRVVLDDLKRRRVPTTSLSISTMEDTDPHIPAELVALMSQTDPLHSVMARELEREVQRALEHLPEILREVIVLRDMENLSYEQAAQVIGCPLGTVKSRLNAAREQLRKAATEWLRER
jgi:RNA polymerase sigma-70 factor (ECF subfamily)